MAIASIKISATQPFKNCKGQGKQKTSRLLPLASIVWSLNRERKMFEFRRNSFYFIQHTGMQANPVSFELGHNPVYRFLLLAPFFMFLLQCSFLWISSNIVPLAGRVDVEVLVPVFNTILLARPPMTINSFRLKNPIMKKKRL